MVYVALIMAVIKILLDFLIFCLKTFNSHEIDCATADGTSCKYCTEQDGKDKCTNILFRRKMIRGPCPRKKCWGFNTGKPIVNESTPLISAPGFLCAKKIIDLFPEFAAALLALNEIFNAGGV